MSKSQYQSNNSDQSQQEQTARHEPVRIAISYLHLAPSAGKIALTRCNLLWFCSSLVEKLTGDFLANH